MPAAAFLPDRRFEQRVAELIRWRMRCQHPGTDGDNEHHNDINQADNGPFIALEIVPELLKRGHGLRRTFNYRLSDLRH
ncbi:hypothetical protein D3C79_826620 [compost metagenome]